MSLLSESGLMMEPQEGMTSEELLGWAEYADREGYGFIFRSDHLLPTSGRRGLPSPECWVTLGAIAARTKRVRFGPMVTPIGFRNPALLARMACTVYELSAGRLELSVGAGWYSDEYAANGIPFPEVRERNSQLREAMSIVLPLVRGERVDFDGKYFSAHTDCLPKPVGRVHLIVGGKAGRTVRTAADFADEWNLIVSKKEEFAKLKAVLDQRAKRKLVVSQMGPFLIGRNQAELEGRVAERMKRRGVEGDVGSYVKAMRKQGIFVGTPEEISSQVAERKSWGFDRFYFQVGDHKDKGAVDLLTDMLKQG